MSSGFGHALISQGTDFLFQESIPETKCFRLSLNEKQILKKTLNWKIIDLLASGTEGAAHYLDFSKKKLAMLVSIGSNNSLEIIFDVNHKTTKQFITVKFT